MWAGASGARAHAEANRPTKASESGRRVGTGNSGVSLDCGSGKGRRSLGRICCAGGVVALREGTGALGVPGGEVCGRGGAPWQSAGSSAVLRGGWVRGRGRVGKSLECGSPFLCRGHALVLRKDA